MVRGDRGRRPGDGVGDAALALGVISLIFVFVPLVGDLVAVPAGLVALGLGLAGFVGAESRDTNPGKAVAGGLLGLFSVFVALMTLAAMGTFI